MTPPDVTADWFLNKVIYPVCSIMGREGDKNMAILLLGTALHESHLIYERQVGGPACGWFQMEPRTHNDLWNGFIPKRIQLQSGMYTLSYGQEPDPDFLVTNQFYATGMGVCFYQRVPAPLPNFNDLQAVASYWKKYWNTSLGKGTEEEFIRDWQAYGGAAAIS